MRRAIVGALAALLLSPLAAAAAVPVTLLVPVRERAQPARQADAAGTSYPVFRAAPDAPLFAAIRKVLDGEPAQASLRLDRWARNARAAEERAKGRAPGALLTSPMFLLVSDEEGGFARRGFWLEGEESRRALVMAGYVDLVVSESQVEDGGFEEIFCHELAHLVLGVTFGPTLEGPSPKMHQSMTVTDDATAFNEGYAESFQPLARDLSANPRVVKAASGTTTGDLEALWLSRADQALRTAGVKQNLFVYEKAPPGSALDDGPDRHRIFQDGETGTAFVVGELKTGQQMLACEGVVATLFYRFANDERLRASFREPGFYAPFLGEAPAEPAKALSPLDNVQLKLLAAIREAGKERSTRPVTARVVSAYARLFPDEAKRLLDLFLSTTRGATASQKLALLWREAGREGLRGSMKLFRQRSKEAFALLDATVEEARSGKLAVDANVGPSLWRKHAAFLIAGAPWVEERDTPFVLNLNTATVPELMTVPGVSLAVARRIVAARGERGFFGAVEDLATVEGVPAAVARAFAALPRMEAPPTGGAAEAGIE